jgi:hypothetical protein
VLYLAAVCSNHITPEEGPFLLPSHLMELPGDSNVKQGYDDKRDSRKTNITPNFDTHNALGYYTKGERSHDGV